MEISKSEVDLMARILIADNELSLVAELEEHLLAAGHKLSGHAVSGPKALKMATEVYPDLILMEVKLSGHMDGITTAIRIKEVVDIPIVFMSWYGDHRTIAEARWARPSAYFLKPLEWARVISAIDSILDDDMAEMPNLREPSPGGYVNLIRGPDMDKKHRLKTLTPSETRIADLIVKGMHTEEIARRLKLKKCTVHWHQKNIRRKMGLVGSRKNLISTLMLCAPIHSIPPP